MRGIFLFLFIVTTAFTVSTTRRWIRYKSHCFQTDARGVNHTMAKDLCKKKSAVLTYFSDKKELDFVQSHIEHRPWYWLAATRKNGVGDFRWENGRLFPKSWWASGQPNENDACLLLLYASGSFQLHGTLCTASHGFVCLKPARWRMVRKNRYYFGDLCGVEIMPNCENLSCENVCRSHQDCDRFAEMFNLCVNIKNVSQTDNCIIKLRPSLKLYEWYC